MTADKESTGCAAGMDEVRRSKGPPVDRHGDRAVAFSFHQSPMITLTFLLQEEMEEEIKYRRASRGSVSSIRRPSLADIISGADMGETVSEPAKTRGNLDCDSGVLFPFAPGTTRTSQNHDHDGSVLSSLAEVSEQAEKSPEPGLAAAQSRSVSGAPPRKTVRMVPLNDTLVTLYDYDNDGGTSRSDVVV